MKKIFNDAKLLAELSALLIVSSIGLVVYAGGGNPGQGQFNPSEQNSPEITCGTYFNEALCSNNDSCMRKDGECMKAILKACIAMDNEECASAEYCRWENSQCVDFEPAQENLHDSIPDGIYPITGEDGIHVKTIIYDNTKITIKIDDQPGLYQWGTTNPEESYSSDINAWGGSGDRFDNLFSPNPTNLEIRKGPCDSGYHVPSAGEWSKLVVSYCQLNKNGDCSSTELFDRGTTLFLIYKEGIGNRFLQDFNMWGNYWASSHVSDNVSEQFYVDDWYVDSEGHRLQNKDDAANIRCMKNEVLEPKTFKVTFKKNGGRIATGSVGQILSGDMLDLSKYSATKDGYDFKGWGTSWNATEVLDDEYVVTGDVTLYAIFEEEWDTASLTTNEDGSKTITWSGINLTIASGDLPGIYQWGTTDSSQNYSTDRNAWGGGGDNANNGFDNKNSKIERQGPCNPGWHIPSRGERQNIITAWCHFSGNDCAENNLAENSMGNYTQFHLSGAGLGQQFLNYFGLGNYDQYPNYWTSSPADQYQYALLKGGNNVTITEVNFGENRIRCVKNPTKTVYFNANGGTTSTVSVQIAEGMTLDLNNYKATKSEYDFVGRGTSPSSTVANKLPSNYVVKGDITLYAIFQRISSGGNSSSEGSSSSGGSSRSSGGGGRKSSSTDTVKQTNTGNAVQNNANKLDNEYLGSGSKSPSSNETSKGQKVPELDMERYNPEYSLEQNQAYQFAYTYGITNKLNIANANMSGKLTRIQMAKMLSTYAINVLGKEPDYSRGSIKFSDVSNSLDRKYSNGVTLAYQLGIMGQNIRSGKFRPYDEVTRAEFATALSRMLYGTKDGTGKVKYYEPHLAKLYNEGIISKRNPNMKEKRGYVMLMLTRSVK